MAIGEHIRDLRWDAHLKQVELARRAGIAQNTLSQIELGNTVPSVATLEKIAHGLGVDLSELLKEPAPKGNAPQESGRFIHRTVSDAVAVRDAVNAILEHLDAAEAECEAHGVNGEVRDLIRQARELVAA